MNLYNNNNIKNITIISSSTSKIFLYKLTYEKRRCLQFENLYK